MPTPSPFSYSFIQQFLYQHKNSHSKHNSLSEAAAMSQYDQQHQAPVYPPPPTSYAAADAYKGPYVAAPPPMGYPTKDGNQQGHGPVETRTKGDGFLKGCLAGLCCCCCLDVCF